MNQPHPDDLLIPFYAAGTLDERERARVERRLAESPEARELLELARAAAARGGGSGEGSLEEEPVHPLLLTLFAENAESLDDETRRHVEALLARSALSRDALERLRETLESRRQAETAPAVERPAAGRSPLMERVWNLLRSTVLHPIPALAYLLLAAALLPALLQRSGPPLSVPGEITVADAGTRRGEGEQEAPALELPGDAPLLLRLETGLLPADLEAPDTRWELSLEQGGRELWHLGVDPARIERHPGGAILPVVIDPSALRPGKEYELLLRIRRPGDLLDGQALFRRRLRRGTQKHPGREGAGRGQEGSVSDGPAARKAMIRRAMKNTEGISRMPVSSAMAHPAVVIGT